MSIKLLCMKNDIFKFLSEHNIDYQRVDHPAVYTCEEAEKLVPPMPGIHTKNLFVRDKKGRNHFLVVVSDTKSVDLKALSTKLQVTNLSFGSSSRLQKYLGVEAGAVSLLAIVNDEQSVVEVVLDRDIWNGQPIQCHPLVNTSTLAINQGDIERFFEITNHNWRVISIPESSR
jgi:Ala-tRNA(Pro) deacylase